MSICLTYEKEFLTKCKNGKPGISEVWLANYVDLNTVTLDAAGEIIETITVDTYGAALTPPPYSSGAFFRILTNRESSTASNEAIIDVPNGTSINKPMVSFKISGMDKTVAKAFKQLMEAPVVAIIKTVDGNFWLAGKDNGLDMESGSMLSFGTTSTDFAGAEINLSGLEADPILPINHEPVAGFDVYDVLVTV